MSEVQAQTDIAYHAERIVPVEVASELLNSARARIFARADALSTVDAPAAERLEHHARDLRRLQARLDPRQPATAEAIIAKWGPLLKDEAAFWAELAPPVAA